MTKVIYPNQTQLDIDQLTQKFKTSNDLFRELGLPEWNFKVTPDTNGTFTFVATKPGDDGSTPAKDSASGTTVRTTTGPTTPTTGETQTATDVESLFKRDVNLANLHPVVRTAIAKVIDELQNAKIPLRPFEAYRSPQRQAQLYAQGRTSPGPIVTYANAWRSYHQYGVAVDFAFFVNGNWTWNEPEKGMWDKLHSIGEKYGMMALSFETPHLQLAGTSSNALYHGKYPEGGDENWAVNLARAIETWNGAPKAPPLPTEVGKMPVS